jgi:magnesium transporter
VTEVLHGFEAANRERVAALRAQRRFFWLDVSLGETSSDDLVQALGAPERALRILAGSGEARTARRSHADRESIVFVVHCYVESKSSGDEAAYRFRPIEVRVVVTSDYLLTAHEESLSLPAILAPDLPEGRSERYVVYSVLDAMLASTFDALEEVELQLDALAEGMTEDGGGGLSRSALRSTGARLARMRRWARAEQAVSQRIGVEIGMLPGFDTDDEPYFDRLDEELNRLLPSIDAAANGMGMLLDLQLNERAYVVSVVATIFVPLTFVTGYFGMNFGWMTDQIDTPVAYWLLGLALPVVAGVLSWRFLVRRFVTGAGQPSKRR